MREIIIHVEENVGPCVARISTKSLGKKTQVVIPGKADQRDALWKGGE